MPGLLGLTCSDALGENSREAIGKMSQMMLHRDFYQQEPVFCDDRVCATRIHVNILQKQSQPYHCGQYLLWLDGEFYKQDELCRQYGLTPQSDPELFISLYQQNQNFSFLKKIDGVFVACLYDTKAQKLYLISDRHGMRRLYWTIYKNSLVWSGELKAFLALPEYQPQIDPYAVEDFLGLRYFINDRTWFADVKLFPAATVLTWDIQEQSLSQQRYWWWQEVPLLKDSIDRRELVEELGRRFRLSVESRSHSSDRERVGLTLSGGLDSRAILAAIPPLDYPLETVTLGQSDCEDVQIAQKVAKVKGANFYPVDINAENWLQSRGSNIWQTDGSCSILHMHFVPILKEIERLNLYESNLHGAGGDGIVGGDHLLEKEQFSYYVEKRLGLNNFALSGEHKRSILQRFQEYFNHLDNSFHILYIDNRIRSFLAKDFTLSLVAGRETRLPFLDNQLTELLYSIPLHLKQGNKLYEDMLLATFPKFYRTIPRQGTGEPIGPPNWNRKMRKTTHRLQTKITRKLKFLGIHGHPNPLRSQRQNFIHPNLWIRQQPARVLYDRILNNPNAYYRNHLSSEQVQNIQQAWQDHLNGKNLADKLSLALTFEIWLQQVFAGNYRSDLDF
jgi:asparagine synthase (glutamine-hydrolysing)